ncbi:hypothetical protein F5Y16DRAFT_392614 [Xylariaceae sp. FL0255]|nr:hypothetical protein F5Y16DRAFT_392614 [Xylariaceae sp. FL0255]
MQQGRYQPIRPAAPSKHDEREWSTSSSSIGPVRQISRPRSGACAACRNRKTKCDGTRPVCGACSKRGVNQCSYPERPGHAHRALEVVNLLRALPEEQASVLVDCLRHKEDSSAALVDFQERGGSVSELNTFKLNQTTLEDELIAHNNKTYSAISQIDPHSLARSHLLRPTRSSVEGSISNSTLASSGEFGNGPRSPSLSFDKVLGAPIKLCDQRLSSVQANFWTDISISNDLAARVLSLYIRTDHPLLGLFNPDLLIDDLLNKQTRFCSRFLFHAIMYFGCQSYSAFNKAAISHASAFGAEAEKLWLLEADSYLGVAGGVLLSISLMGHGKDHAVLKYANEAMEMGHRLHLFATDLASIPRQYDNLSLDEERSALCYAAWGAFNWNVMISVFYRQPGSKTPHLPPTLPIPGAHNITSNGSNTDEGRLLGKLFPFLCAFWRLVHKVNWIYYAVEESPPLNLRATLAEYAFRELVAWVERLPMFLIRRDRNPHYVTVFHIWLHTAILDMFQPFINKPPSEAPRLDTFTAEDNTPEALYQASLNQLKHLVIDYRTHHAASTYSILWHTGLIYLAHGVLSGNDPDWHLYFLLCIYGYERLSRPFRVVESISQGLLSMALRDTNMSGTEAHRILHRLKSHGLERVKKDLKEQIRATFMVDLDLALTDPDAATAEHLAGDFDDLALFQDLIETEGYQMELCG